MLKTCGIYKITSPIGKIYIGQSVDVYERESTYRRLRCANQPKLFLSIKKYGWGSHVFDVIHVCEKELLNENEIFYIKFYDSFESRHGLNLQSGGNSRYSISLETKDKLRQINLGKKTSAETRLKIANGNKGKAVSLDTARKISLSLTGKKQSTEHKASIAANRIYRPLSQSHRDRISKAHKGKKRSPSTGLKISLAKKGKCMEGGNKLSRPVFQMSKTGEVIKKWDCSIQVLAHHTLMNVVTGRD